MGAGSSKVTAAAALPLAYSYTTRRDKQHQLQQQQQEQQDGTRIVENVSPSASASASASSSRHDLRNGSVPVLQDQMLADSDLSSVDPSNQRLLSTENTGGGASSLSDSRPLVHTAAPSGQPQDRNRSEEPSSLSDSRPLVIISAPAPSLPPITVLSPLSFIEGDDNVLPSPSSLTVDAAINIGRSLEMSSEASTAAESAVALGSLNMRRSLEINPPPLALIASSSSGPSATIATPLSPQRLQAGLSRLLALSQEPDSNSFRPDEESAVLEYLQEEDEQTIQSYMETLELDKNNEAFRRSKGLRTIYFGQLASFTSIGMCSQQLGYISPNLGLLYATTTLQL